MRKKIISLLLISFFILNIGIGKVFAYENVTDFYNLIKSNASDTNIDFSIRSGAVGKETNGIYTTTETNSGKEIYYYRGNVNNNVIFNNMCWKIIRTTETGGIKLIYNGLPTDGKCAATGSDTEIGKSAFNELNDDNAHVGYMYGTVPSTTIEEAQANINDSTIKTYIDNWYKANFTDTAIISKIEDTVFYNDRSFSKGGDNNTYSDVTDPSTIGYGNNTTLYGSLAKTSYYTIKPKPTLKYLTNNDKFTVNTKNGNGMLKYPVGLLTLDEAILAGFNTFESNNLDYKDTNNYLYTGNYYWTMTPVILYSTTLGHLVISGSTEGIVAQDSIGNNFNHDDTVGVRPVISLANGAIVRSDGDGSSDNPYIVSLYTIQFDSNSGSAVDNQYIFDDNSKIEKPTDPIKENYTFAGWYADEELSEEYNFDEIVTKDMTLYAKWEEKHIEQDIQKDEQENKTIPPTGEFNIMWYACGAIALSVIGIILSKKR